MIKAILTDIEGTTSSLSFVKDVLFPYARKNLSHYILAREKDVKAILDEVREFEKNDALTTAEIISLFERWIDEDRKITPLKTLQGLIWRKGYEEGDFKGHIYEDAARNLRHWKEQGLKLYVYSSGSVAAQKLLFAHTEEGDLTSLFSGYFDTTIGSKVEITSYKKIAIELNLAPSSILFLSDNPQETNAAAESGMQIILVDRDNANSLRNTTGNFDEITIKEKAA